VKNKSKLYFDFRNSTDFLDGPLFNRAKRLEVSRDFIEYEGEDSWIGILFASKAAIQVLF